MLFEEADIIASYLKRHMRFSRATDYVIKIVGSVARKEDAAKDIDFLIITPGTVRNLLKTVYFTSDKIKIDKMTDCGDHKCFVHLIVEGKSLKIDLFHTIKVNESFALLHHIGPKSYLLRIRRLAKLKGYLLNQYGIFDRETDKKIKGQFDSVCDIQKFLNISCRPPAKRR